MRNDLVPYNVLNKNKDTPKAAAALAIGSTVLSTVGIGMTSIAVASAVGWAVILVGATIVTSAILKALLPKPPKGQQGLLTNIREASAPADVVYGQVRKGGVITYLESTGTDNKYLHMFITMAGHEVEEIGDVYINDKVATIDGNNLVTTATDGTDTDDYKSKVYIRKFTGSSTQDIYATLNSLTNKPSLPSDFKGKGVACIYVRLEYDKDVFTSGIPTFTAVIKGKKVKNLAGVEQTYPASANAALVIRDYLLNSYGLDTLDSTVDSTSFGVAVTDCDTDVALSGGGTQKKYTVDGVIGTGASIQSNLTELVACCGGSLFYSGGKFKLVTGVYSSSVKTLTLDDLRSPISVSTRASRRDNFNSVTGTFVDSNDDWIEADYSPIKSTTFLEEDGGLDNALQLNFPLVTNNARAERLAKLTMYRAREQMTIQAEFGLEAFDLEVGDTVALPLERYGWDNLPGFPDGKEFEVVEWGLKADGDTGDLRVMLTLRETSSAAFDWNAEESTLINNNSTLPNPFLVPTIGLNLSSGVQAFTEKISNKLKIEVTSSSPWAVDKVQVQLKYRGSSDNIKKTDLTYAILRAAVTLEPEYTLFGDNVGVSQTVDGTRFVGDINDDANVGSDDSLQMYKYLSGVTQPQSEIDFIEGEMFPHILANQDLYQDYLIDFLDIDANFRDVNEGPLGNFEYLDAPAGTYDVRARAINQVGVVGDWVTVTDFTLDNSALPVPPDVTNFHADVSNGNVELEWDDVESKDLSYYKIRHSPVTSGATWSNSTTAVAKVGRPSTSVTLPARVGTYLIKAYSKAGKESSNAVSAVVVSGQLDTFATTLSQVENPTFSGTKTDTQVVSNNLELTSAGYIYPSNPDPEYIFSADIDAGQDRRVLCRIDCTNNRRDLGAGLFDDIQGNIDSLAGNWDDLTGTPQFDDTDVDFFIAVSPSGGSFGDYQKFRIGYFYGRYFRFKVKPKTRSINVTPSISDLAAYVEYN